MFESDEQVVNTAIKVIGGIITFLVVPIILALIFWPSYNHSVVKMSTNPATNKPRLTEVDFVQSLLFVILVYVTFGSITRIRFVLLDRLQST